MSQYVARKPAIGLFAGCRRRHRMNPVSIDGSNGSMEASRPAAWPALSIASASRSLCMICSGECGFLRLVISKVSLPKGPKDLHDRWRRCFNRKSSVTARWYTCARPEDGSHNSAAIWRGSRQAVRSDHCNPCGCWESFPEQSLTANLQGRPCLEFEHSNGDASASRMLKSSQSPTKAA